MPFSSAIRESLPFEATTGFLGLFAHLTSFDTGQIESAAMNVEYEIAQKVSRILHLVRSAILNFVQQKDRIVTVVIWDERGRATLLSTLNQTSRDTVECST